VLIQIINNFPITVLRDVDQNFSKLLKAFIKAPMVLILGIAGAFCGITNTCIKFTGEIIAEGNFLEDPTLVIIFLSIVAFSAFFLLFSVNYCMRYYDQIDVMPTYFAQILI
jgi:hypothetical protein